ncbi:hypothetical protein MMC26_000811 [Xylographa opegraphella]|nr:hypothetical protein [Xylographa opegraphella]
MAAPASIPTTMRAQQWTSIPTTLSAALRLNTSAPVTSKPLKPDQVLVHVHYSSLNPVDYKIPEFPLVGRLAISKPAIPCVDFCGTVAAAGSGRQDLSPGQWVFGMLDLPAFGACAEYVVASNKEGCVALPDGVKPEEAATIGVAGLTAYLSLIPHLSKIVKTSNDSQPRVFINGGSGGTGIYAIQIAKAKGCFVATTCSARNVELCYQLGADQVIDYTKQDVVAALEKIAQSQGGPFDLVVDNVGGATPVYWQSHRYLTPTGKFVAVGGDPSLQGVVDFAKIFLWPRFLGGGQRKYVIFSAVANAEGYRVVAEMLAEGKVRVVIEEIYGLEDLGRAFERLKTGRVRGKLVIKVTE